MSIDHLAEQWDMKSARDVKFDFAGRWASQEHSGFRNTYEQDGEPVNGVSSRSGLPRPMTAFFKFRVPQNLSVCFVWQKGRVQVLKVSRLRPSLLFPDVRAVQAGARACANDQHA